MRCGGIRLMRESADADLLATGPPHQRSNHSMGLPGDFTCPDLVPMPLGSDKPACYTLLTQSLCFCSEVCRNGMAQR